MKNYQIFILLFVFICGVVYGQNPSESFKNQAIVQMKQGKYGEAIDLLNKYISAEPTKHEGFHLRGLSYEKRDQLEMAVFDLRAARKLAPKNQQVSADLDRMTRTWHEQIYQKIEGHRREIAIDPSIPVNYLEIGKSFKRLGQWLKAEEWYDEYIKREDPSPDEVIRYTEILAKNNHIEKGEKILKIYVGRFPLDHRLWSRYGYFTLWLGKNKIAIEAFETALARRPFFKEAIDGLDLARGKGYTYTYYDTAHYNRAKEVKIQKQQEYAIDKYYRILKNNTNDVDTRYLLIKELWDVNRIQEVSEQLDILSKTESGKTKYEELSERFFAFRDELYNKEIDKARIELDNDPSNKNALLKYAEMCGALQRYDESIEAFNTYFNIVGTNVDPKIRYYYSQAAAWNRDYTHAIEQMDILLKEYPNNLEYQLLRGQLSAWTGIELEVGKTYLENVVAAKPDNLQALVSLGYITLQQGEFEQAQLYVDAGKKIDPNDQGIMQLESDIEVRKLRAEQDRLFRLLDEARQEILDYGCEVALPKFEEYISKSQPNLLVMREYAAVLACAKQFDKAISVLSDLLSQEYDVSTDLNRARIYYWSGDSVTALSEFQRLVYSGSNDFESRLYLADSYSQMQMYSEARGIYDSLLDNTSDPVEIGLVELRLGWLPVTGFTGFLSTFPSYIILYPAAYYFSDNVGYRSMSYGLKGEVGVLSFMSLTVSALRGALKSQYVTFDYNSLSLGTYIRLSSALVVGGSYGKAYYQYGEIIPFAEYFVRIAKDSLYSLQVSFTSDDAAQALTSVRLVNWNYSGDNIRADIYRANGQYWFRSGARVTANYAQIMVSDGNTGQSFDIRAGKFFYPDLIAGYEYTSVIYARHSELYYSPGGAETHAVWADWESYKTSEMTLTLGGRFGIIPANNFLFKTLYVQLAYKFLPNFSLHASANYSDTVREIVGYSSRMLAASIIWQL